MKRISMPTMLAVIVSGAFWFASLGVHHVWPLAWLVPLPLLLVIPDLRARHAALAAFAASVLGAVNLVLAYHRLPPIVLVFGVLFIALPFTLVALVWRAFTRRAHHAIAIITFPALVVSVEYIISLISANGSFGSIAYSQADVPTVVQLASVTGIWGISFVVSLVPAVLAVTWRKRRESRAVYAGLALMVVPVAAMLVFGVTRFAKPSPSRQLRVGLAANDSSAHYFDTQNSVEALAVIRAYAARADVLADRGAEIIVLPEKFVGVTPAYAESARSILAAVARERHVMIVAGFNEIGASERRNVAVVFAPDGSVALEYEKMHPIPGEEAGYRRGNAIGLIASAPAPTGVAICKDLDFVPLGRAYARAGVGVLLVPAWDFVNDGWLHSRMAVLRGVEGGYAVVRTATRGLLTVSDARGRIVAERESSATQEVLLTANVPVGSGIAFYSRTGDWFAWSCIIASLACIAAGWRAAPQTDQP